MSTATRGDISIYIALTTAMIMIGSAVLLGLLLARQISLTKDLVASERAFYAANAGQEAGFYQVALLSTPAQPDVLVPVDVSGTIDYATEAASYVGKMKFQSGIACGFSEGIFPDPNGTKRRLAVGPTGCL